MGIVVLALVVSAPLQLAAAAGIEASAGYDSTVPNPFTQVYNDGGMLRLALDVQVGHLTETLRHTLRSRGEFYFVGGESRTIDQANITSFNRYSLTWAPDDNWRIGVNAGYNVGQGPLLMQVGNATAPAFFRGIFGEYTVGSQVTRALGENARIGLSGALNGRHTIEVPEGVPPGDMVQVTGTLNGSFEVGESNTFGLATSPQGLQIVQQRLLHGVTSGAKMQTPPSILVSMPSKTRPILHALGGTSDPTPAQPLRVCFPIRISRLLCVVAMNSPP
jgi:hypothetical protein